MKDFKIEINETVVINDIKITRINKLYYIVDNNRLKKKDVLQLINKEQDVVDVINRQLEINNAYYRAERIDEECFICNNRIYVTGDKYVSTYEYDEFGNALDSVDECVLKHFYDKVENRLFKTLRQSYNKYNSYASVGFVFYKDDTDVEVLIRECLEVLDNDIDSVYMSYSGQINNILAKTQQDIRELFMEDKEFKSASVENMFKTKSVIYYNEIYELIKNVDNRDELENVLNNYYANKKESILNEIDLIIRSEEEYKRRSADEVNKKYTTNENKNVVKEMIKGMSYKQACKLLHPDISKLENATELFKELQSNKEKWFDSDGNWREFNFSDWLKGSYVKKVKEEWDGRDRRKSKFPF